MKSPPSGNSLEEYEYDAVSYSYGPILVLVDSLGINLHSNLISDKSIFCFCHHPISFFACLSVYMTVWLLQPDMNAKGNIHLLAINETCC